MTESLRQWRFVDVGIDHLRRHDAALPAPAAREILVRVEAASLNYRDLMVAEGRYGAPPVFPFVPASDLAGVVQAVGRDVRRWKVGDRVLGTYVAGWLDGVAPPDAFQLGYPGPGALASHVLLDEQWAVAIPPSLTPVQASTLPIAGLTAWQSLVELGALRAGQAVLVHGTGGVALFGVQIARQHGARAIVVTGGGPGKREGALAAGAQHVLERHSDWPAEVRRLTGGRGADHVLEIAGGINLARSLEAVAQGGRVSLIGVLDGNSLSGDAFVAIRSRATIQGISTGHRRALEELVRAVDATGLQPVIAAEYGFDEAPAAFAHLKRGPVGKIVLRL
jgi:NADPH:quinone reductase-like Zn-dependent oxidoreductase